MNEALLALVREKQFALQPKAVAATVTRPAPDDTPIETRGIWLAPVEQDVPLGAPAHRADMRRVIALPRPEVPTVPVGTLIVAAEFEGGTTRTWRVDGLFHLAPEDTRVTVIEIAESS